MKKEYLKNIKVGALALSTLFLLNGCGSKNTVDNSDTSVMAVKQSDVNLDLNINENETQIVGVINENGNMMLVKLDSYEKYASSFDIAPSANLISNDLLWELHTTDGEVIIKSIFDVTIFEGVDALNMAMRYASNLNEDKARILSLN